jgi:two-component system, LytTR family, sensor kinase
LYTFILAISFALDSRGRLAMQQAETARLNEQLSMAQLSALRQQIEPHFIFNALNAVAGLVREDRKDAAVNMIVALSDFLRRVAKDFTDSQVRLAQELEFLEKYLEIQKVRFAGRLCVSLQVPAELLGARVPSLILQPLVENAIKHGIEKRAQGGAVRVAAASSAGRLNLSVYNEGPLLEEKSLDGQAPRATGIGLSNLRTRLELLYGSEFEMTLKNHDAAGVLVSVSLPHREGG